MKRATSLVLLLFASFLTCNAQAKLVQNSALNKEQQEVLDVVVRLFDGMREADSSKVHAAFRDNVRMYTSFTNKSGDPILHEGELQKFLDAVGTPHEQLWDEPIWDAKVNIDGNLASVWVKYAFYADKNFSHCGVDAFMLNKDKEGWQIFHITDTRQRQGCEIPDEIRKGRDL